MVAILLKASFIIVILLAFYKLFLEKESFFTANRIFLLGSIILTFLLPFISLPKLVDEQGFISNIIERTDDRVSVSSPAPSVLPEKSGEAVGVEQDRQVKSKASLLDWLLRLYYFGAAIFALNLLVQIGHLLIKAKKSTDKVRGIDGMIINNGVGESPCSFFNYIFINTRAYDYKIYEQILEHETIHVRKVHAIDLLLAEIAIIFLWFNPAVWILKSEVEKNIEFETDDHMLKKTTVEKQDYQMNLLEIATHTKPLSITTNYNQSLIKQRILRMNAKKSNRHSYWKYAFMAPLLFAILLVINKPVSVIAGNSDENTLLETAEQRISNDCQALLKAVKEKNADQVKRLLSTVDPNCTYRDDDEPRSPLVAAARVGNLVIGKMLIDAGAEVEFHAPGDETPLMAAAAGGHLDFVKHLVTNHADVNQKLLGDGCALLVASREGRLEVVSYLISQGADVNAQINGDGTALICAVRSGHYEVTRLLLENGADPYLISPGDEYAMYHARMSNNKSMIDLLKKYEKEN
jgi:ankyrin repeat protein